MNYSRIAEILKDTYHENYHDAYVLYTKLIENLSNYFAAQDKEFDREKFFHDCR